MTAFFWVDVSALAASAIIAFALIFTVLGSDVRRAVNRRFILFAAAEAFWAICSLLLRLALWLGRGSPLVFAELATLGLQLIGVSLLAFTVRHVGCPARGPALAAYAALAAIAVSAIALFQHRVVSNPRLLANGSTVADLGLLGFVLAPIPIGFIIWSLLLFWRDRRRSEERTFPLSMLVLLLGLISSSILQLPFPILSIANASSLALIGYKVISSQLFNPLRARTARLSVVNRIAAAVGRILEPDELMETVYQEIVPVFQPDAFFIALYDGATDELDFRLQVDEGKRDPPNRQPVGTGLTSWVLRTNQPLLVSDLARDLKHLPEPELYGTMKLPASWLGVPMRIGERVVGVICVQSYVPSRYDAEEQQLLMTIADQVAIAAENARLYETARQELAERRHTERVLRESEEKFRNLAEQSPNMIFINAMGRVVYANKKCEELMGYTRQEFYAEDFDFLQLIAAEHRDRAKSAFVRHQAGQEVPPYEYRLLTKNGKRLEVIITTKLISFEGRQALLGIITDISDRERTERLLTALNGASLAMERAQAPQTIFSMAGEEFKRFGFDSVVLLYDEKKEALRLAYSSYDAQALAELEEVIRLQLERFALPVRPGGILERIVGGRETIFSSAADSLHRSFPDLLESAIEQVLDLLKISRTISSPLVTEDEVIGMLSVQSGDLSEEDVPAVTAFANQMAAAWRRASLVDDLRNSLEELKATQEQLLQAQKMEAVGKLAGGIAHDFNNLLTAINGYTDLLLQKIPEHDSGHADLAEVKKASEQAARLTRQLLAFSRKQMLQPRILNLNDMILRVREMLQRLIGEHIELVTRLAGELKSVKADPGQMDQVILNLVVNARDAMPEGGTLILETANVTVESRKPCQDHGLVAGSYVTLSVRDTGRGMDRETRRHMFEPFFTTKETGKGTGLGLSTVYGIVRQSEGTILVDSEPRHGTTVTIYLPAVEDIAETEAVAPSDRERLQGRETVLLVEDEDSVRALARRVLEGYGYTVLEAAQAAQALEIAGREKDSIRLMITDVIMPGGMNGGQLAEAMARLRPDMGVLYISGYADAKMFPKEEPGKTFHFLAKPFSPRDLVRKVRQLLDGSVQAVG